MKILINSTITAILILIVSSCTTNDCFQGEGAIVTKSLSLATFNKLETHISSEIIISQGEEQSVSVIGNQNIIDNLSISILNKTAIIDLVGCFSYDTLKINIVVPKIHEIVSTGSDAIDINDFVNQKELSLLITGSGKITLGDFKNLETVTSKITGSGDVIFGEMQSSVLKTANINSTGSGMYKAFSILANDYSVSLSGSGNCEINVNDNLDITLSGSGNIYYKGKPKLSLKISGSGNIENVNN